MEIEEAMNDVIEMVAEAFDARVLRKFFIVGGRTTYVVLEEKREIPRRKANDPYPAHRR
jgi:hypothetical protein